MKYTISDPRNATEENAPYLLECQHCIGRNCRIYYKKCHVLKVMSDGRLKVKSFGFLFWGSQYLTQKQQTKPVVRYVESRRVSPVDDTATFHSKCG